jgi:hypothetical protein
MDKLILKDEVNEREKVFNPVRCGATNLGLASRARTYRGLSPGGYWLLATSYWLLATTPRFLYDLYIRMACGASTLGD